jgi:hypothetical protein
MQYQVFVQNPSARRFVASIANLPSVMAEGQTKEEAVANAKALLESQLAIGEFVTIEVGASGLEGDPWVKQVGIFEDDPTFDDFLAEVAAYRQMVDARDFDV